MSETPTDPPSDPLGSSTIDDAPPRCPFAPEPKPSIGHLMVWAACVAVYMSAFHTINLAREEDALDGPRAVMFGLSSLISGAYLAGLLLLASRRIRHQKFPRSGGEILWLFGMVGVFQSLSLQLISVAVEDQYQYYVYRLARAVAGIFVWLPIYFYAIRSSRRHWQAYYLFLMIAGFVFYVVEGSVLSTLGGTVYLVGFLVHILIFTIALSLVSWLDLRSTAPRYPWPHWTGILLGFFHNAVAALWYVYYLIQEISQAD